MFPLRLLGFLAALVLAGIAAAPAPALVSIEGTGEPAFTNTTTNTVFVRYQGDGFSTYRLHFRYIVAGSLFTDDLRDKESAKIECGKAHFAALGVGENPALYRVATSFQDVLKTME